MKKYLRNIMFFIISSFIITFVFSTSLQGLNPVISLQDNVYLTDKAVEKEVVLYNYLSEAVYFDLKLNSSPFVSQISSERVFLLPNEYKTVTYKIYPLNDSLDSTYTASFESVFAGNRSVKYFTINQAFNKECKDLSLDLSYVFLEDGSINLKLLFKNSSQLTKSAKIMDVSGLSFDLQKEIVIAGNSDYLYDIILSDSLETVNVKYSCNNLVFNKEINIEQNNPLTGYFSLKFLDGFLNSVYFTILLIIFLVVLVLSFSTRYLKHTNKKWNL